MPFVALNESNTTRDILVLQVTMQICSQIKKTFTKTTKFLYESAMLISGKKKKSGEFPEGNPEFKNYLFWSKVKVKFKDNFNSKIKFIQSK